MNEALKGLAVKAGAPKEVLEELWFNMFCMKFANVLIEAMEEYDELQPLE